MSTEERRGTPRVRIVQIAEWIQEDSPQSGTPNKLLGHAVDLSTGGVRFEAQLGFRVGSTVIINFAVDGRIVAAKGKVVHFMVGNDGKASVGLKFTALHDADRQLIEDYCNKALPKQTPIQARLVRPRSAQQAPPYRQAT